MQARLSERVQEVLREALTSAPPLQRCQVTFIQTPGASPRIVRIVIEHTQPGKVLIENSITDFFIFDVDGFNHHYAVNGGEYLGYVTRLGYVHQEALRNFICEFLSETGDAARVITMEARS